MTQNNGPTPPGRSAGFLKYFRNTSWLFVDKVVRLGAVLITSIFVTRYLGPELFGQLNYASAFVGIFFALTSMGLDDILIRDLVRTPEKRDKLMGTAASIKLGGAVVLFITVMTLAFAKHMDTTTIMMVFLIAAAEFLKPLVVVEQYFYSQVKGRTAAQVNMVTVIIASLFRLGLILVHAPLVWFAWAYMVEMAASAIGFLIAYRKEGSTWKHWRYSKETALYLLRQSWPLVIYGLALYVQAKIDQVMIGDILTKTMGQSTLADAEVGQYSAALEDDRGLGLRAGHRWFWHRWPRPLPVPGLRTANYTRTGWSTSIPADVRIVPGRVGAALISWPNRPWCCCSVKNTVMAGYLLSLFAIRLFFTNMGVAKSSFITNESLFKYSLVTSVLGATC
jgi:hypothetical protein